MKIYIFIIVLAFNMNSVIGQNSKKERIQALKIAFMTERIDLSSKEAQQFWPAYNDFEDSLNAIHKEERKTFRYINENIETMDESMAKKALRDLEKFEEGKIEAREKLLNELKKVISYKKTLIFIKAEGDFKNHLLKMLRGRRGN